MTLEDGTIKGLDKSGDAKHPVDFSPLHAELLKDRQSNSPAELKRDLADANKILHANGFPTDLVITDIGSDTNQLTFKTNKDDKDVDVATLTKQYSNQQPTAENSEVIQKGEHSFQTKGDSDQTNYTVENGIVTKIDHGQDGYWERDNTGTYHHYTKEKTLDDNDKDKVPFKGIAVLDSAGNLTITREDKSSRTENHDGSTVDRDAQDRVTKTISSDGKTIREISYVGNQAIVTETVDGIATASNVSAKDVSKGGDVTVNTTNVEGHESHEVRSADGTTVRYDDSVKPPRVSEVHYPNGGYNKFKYDDKGNIEEIEDGNGTEKHTYKPADTNRTATVDAHGVLTLTDNTNPEHPKTMTKKLDGSEVYKDDQGRVTGVVHPDGSKDDFTYDGDSKQVQKHTHTDSTGSTTTPFDRSKKEGNTEDDVSVDEQGNITTTKDGKKTRTSTDGSKEDATNQLEYDSDSNAHLKIKKGMTLWKIAEKALKQAGLPTDVKSVQEEMKAIQNANKSKIKNINKIYENDELIIPKPKEKEAA